MARSKRKGRSSGWGEVPSSGVRLAFDVGAVRIGAARCDDTGILAVPLETIRAGEGALTAVVELVGVWQATGILVGLPLMMDGSIGTAALSAREWAASVAGAVGIPVQLIDERLSTVQAQRGLHDAGRRVRNSRSVIDSASAVVLMQSYLDSVRQGTEHLQRKVLT